MGRIVYAINVVTRKGRTGYVKFNGDGTWDWHIVSDVNEANFYATREECLRDFYDHVQYANSTKDGDSIDISRCRISECYNPSW